MLTYLRQAVIIITKENFPKSIQGGISLNGDTANLCPGCMEPRADGAENCMLCGYNEHTPYLPSYLPPRYMLCERYLIGKLLKYNGEGADYIAYDTYTENKVIIREYMPDTLCTRERDNPEIIPNKESVAPYKTYMSEFIELNKMLTKMRTLNHIVSCTEVFQANNTAYAVLVYVKGITLMEYLQDNAGALSWEEVKKIFPPIFTTLSLVHNAGLVHRGISPENIIMSERGELKLTGFSIADARTANTGLAAEIYSGYAAPEQYSSNNWQGTWTDVYSVSAVLYRMLTGVVPPEAPSRKTNDNLIEPAGLDPNVPKNVSKVIMSGLNMSGEMRIQTVTELVTGLFEQPEFSQSTKLGNTSATITFNRDSLKYSSRNESPAKRDLGKAPLIIIGIVGAAVILGLMIALLITLDDNSRFGMQSGAGTVTVISSDTTMPVLTEPPVTEPTVTAATPAQPSTIYIMSDFVGKVYDTLKNSETYKDNLIFVPEYVYNEAIPKGIIISQSIEKGTNYSKNTELKLVISLGSKYAVIPDFVGVPTKDYFTMLAAAGIKYTEEQEETVDVLEGYVIRTSKQPGETLDIEKGEELVVYVAVNPPDMTVSEVTEQTTTPTATEPEPPLKATETTPATRATDDPPNLTVTR